MTDFKDGLTDKVNLRPVAVEDLLGRPQTPLDRNAMAGLIKGRRVLVTGAGGSIGAELARQICQLAPAAVVASATVVSASSVSITTWAFGYSSKRTFRVFMPFTWGVLMSNKTKFGMCLR